jgi:NADPH:quinone reductase
MARAARLHHHGDPLRIEDVALPDPGEGEVRVTLAFAGVNPVDSYLAAGRVAPDAPLPRTLGGEASGHLDGRPVLVTGSGLGTRRDGVWASAANVPEGAVVPLPDGLDLRAAAALGVAGLTASDVVRLAAVGPADRVLVLGASGGVGLPTVSLVAATGATVWGQTGSADKAEAIRRQGADDVVVTGAEGLSEAVAPLRPSVVIDPLGGAFTPVALTALSPRGRLVLFGTSAGAASTLNLQTLYRNGLTVLGYGGLILSDEERTRGLQEAVRALQEGRLRIAVDRVLPLDRVDDAFGLLSDRGVTGKIVLDLA